MQKHSRNYILPRNSHLVITSTQNRVITVSTGTFRGHNSDDTGGRLSPQKAKWGHDCYLLSHVRLFATPWTAALPGSSVHGDSPGKDTGLGCHALLQGIFLTQGLNPGLRHYRKILYHLCHKGSPGQSKLKTTQGGRCFPNLSRNQKPVCRSSGRPSSC